MSSISEAAVEYVRENGLRVTTTAVRNSKGALLGWYRGGRKERYGFDRIAVPRAAVREAALQNIPAGDIEWGKKVVQVDETANGVKVEFKDGTIEEADLLIGADGVKSIIREAIFGKKYQAEYESVSAFPVLSLRPFLQLNI
jgi:2-polyprenyl-6-methoxyphenol hydroxylase-like FAD-dependent oxidoreductase